MRRHHRVDLVAPQRGDDLGHRGDGIGVGIQVEDLVMAVGEQPCEAGRLDRRAQLGDVIAQHHVAPARQPQVSGQDDGKGLALGPIVLAVLVRQEQGQPNIGVRPTKALQAYARARQVVLGAYGEGDGRHLKRNPDARRRGEFRRGSSASRSNDLQSGTDAQPGGAFDVTL